MSSLSTDSASYWLISVPNWASSGKLKKNQQKNAKMMADEMKLTRRELDLKTDNLSKNFEFPLPNLRVGTLDSILQLSDELGKDDALCESIVKKIERTYHDLNPEADSLSIREQPKEHFLESFRWADNRYSAIAPLKDLVARIKGEILGFEEELKKRMSKYAEITSALAAIERKESGTLLVKPLSKIVDPKDIYEGDRHEYITTLLVVVPKAKQTEFLQTYERVEDNAMAPHASKPENEKEKGKQEAEDVKEAAKENADVPQKSAEELRVEAERQARRDERNARVKNIVPRSHKLLAEDAEFVLYRVIVLRKGEGTVANLFRERRWMVRTYMPNEANEVEKDESRKISLADQKKKLYSSTIVWCQAAFSDSFAAWLHLKVVRIFAESVLRYGIPVDFQAVLLKPKKGHQSKLRRALGETYAHLVSGDLASQNPEDQTGEFGLSAEFYPYVYVPVDLEY